MDLIISIICIIFLFLFSKYGNLFLLKYKYNKIIQKYGTPKVHICGTLCCRSFPLRLRSVFVDIYSEYIVITTNTSEYKIDKNYQNYEIKNLLNYSTFVINSNENDRVEIGIIDEDAIALEEFFDKE